MTVWLPADSANYGRDKAAHYVEMNTPISKAPGKGPRYEQDD